MCSLFLSSSPAQNPTAMWMKNTEHLPCEKFSVLVQECSKGHKSPSSEKICPIGHQSGLSIPLVWCSVASIASFWFLPCCRIPTPHCSASGLVPSSLEMVQRTEMPPSRRFLHPESLQMFCCPTYINIHSQLGFKTCQFRRKLGSRNNNSNVSKVWNTGQMK